MLALVSGTRSETAKPDAHVLVPKGGCTSPEIYYLVHEKTGRPSSDDPTCIFRACTCHPLYAYCPNRLKLLRVLPLRRVIEIILAETTAPVDCRLISEETFIMLQEAFGKCIVIDWTKMK